MKQCPNCKSKDITLYMGGHFGKYMCKKCGYVGPIIVDKIKRKIESNINKM